MLKDYNAMPQEAFCRRCGSELYRTDFYADWNGIICEECLRERIFKKSTEELALTFGIPFGIL